LLSTTATPNPPLATCIGALVTQEFSAETPPEAGSTTTANADSKKTAAKVMAKLFLTYLTFYLSDVS
jgi:hypothetical protein